MKSGQRILTLEPLLSKLIDTFCLELSVTRPDQNSFSLIESQPYLLTQTTYNPCYLDHHSNPLTKQITSEEFSELYQGWIEAKSIQDIFNTKPVQSFDKLELIDKTPKEFLTVHNIIQALEWIDAEYQTTYLNSGRSKNILEAADSIFSYLDIEGVIHLRNSDMFFLFFNLIITRNLPTPRDFASSPLEYYSEFKTQIGSLDGKLSLRNFKNFMTRRLALPESSGLGDITKCFKGFEKHFKPSLSNSRNKTAGSPSFGKGSQEKDQTGKEGLPNLFKVSFERFIESRANKQKNQRKNDIFWRVFQEHQNLFFQRHDQPQSIFNSLLASYGSACFKMYAIDLGVVTELATAVRITLKSTVQTLLRNYSLTSVMGVIKKSISKQQLARTTQIRAKFDDVQAGSKNSTMVATKNHKPIVHYSPLRSESRSVSKNGRTSKSKNHLEESSLFQERGRLSRTFDVDPAIPHSRSKDRFNMSVEEISTSHRTRPYQFSNTNRYVSVTPKNVERVGQNTKTRRLQNKSEFIRILQSSDSLESIRKAAKYSSAKQQTSKSNQRGIDRNSKYTTQGNSGRKQAEHSKLQYFRNKKVEPFETAIHRLRTLKEKEASRQA